MYYWFFTDDDYEMAGKFLGVIFLIALIGYIVYWTIVIFVGGGTLFGGGKAVINYFSSIKETVLKNNQEGLS